MSVGITVEDEFFNKRGEIISHKINHVITANIFKANIFWMGKMNFVKGKKYKIKLATQEVECEILAINKVIDATTLESSENLKYYQKQMMWQKLLLRTKGKNML